MQAMHSANIPRSVGCSLDAVHLVRLDFGNEPYRAA
jgi:hypothetical protein